MRENTKWIMLVTALAFVALMVFDWGMDITGRSAGGLGEIGRVNGDPVFYEDYQLTYRNLYDQYQAAQEEPLTSQQNREIEDQAWEEMVNQILIRQELERRGIAVSDAEIRSAASFQPPPALRQNPAFQTEGTFDPQKYQRFLATQDDQFLLGLEAYYRDVIPRGKLLRQVSSGIYLTDAELWQRWRDQHETAEIRYIPLNPSQRIPDEDIELRESEIEAYYRDHRSDFEVPARAIVEVAWIGKAPTPADTAASADRIARVRSEIVEGGDFAEVARRESSDQGSAQQGGDLGVVQKGQLVPSMDSAAFSLPVGRVSAPIRSTYGWHVLEVQERWGQDSVRARHVLVPVERTDDSEIAMLTLADSLEELGENLPLREAATRAGLTTDTVEITEVFAFVPGVGQAGEGSEWAFEEAEPGDVSPVFENRQAFYAMELVSRQPAGVLPLEQARPSIEQALTFEKKMARARAEGEEVVQAIREGTPLPNAAADAGLEVRNAGPFTRNDFVPGVGRQNAVVGAAFGLRPGQVSGVVETPTNAFIVEVLAHQPADSAAWAAQRDQQRAQLESGLQQERLQAWLDGLRSAASILDRRDEVLQPADEDVPLGGGGGFGF